ncbi:hypothetical protein P3X46_032418 [Hevea brasiliensis]|uniref:Uncharacterized protein n=1 Tax=Hevea brasiliensis TaxID=3981 RepID=A0ABQ9KED3_HEVBR|nr:hypothetical protein P3X46_032418 [Hevea brasiliensis]
MASALQRSTISFRRQGSSGRIWDNLHIYRKASGAFSGPLLGKATDKSQELYLKNIEKGREEAFQQNKDTSNSSSSTSPMPPSKPENEIQMCKVLSLFRSCMGSPTAKFSFSSSIIICVKSSTTYIFFFPLSFASLEFSLLWINLEALKLPEQGCYCMPLTHEILSWGFYYHTTPFTRTILLQTIFNSFLLLYSCS